MAEAGALGAAQPRPEHGGKQCREGEAVGQRAGPAVELMEVTQPGHHHGFADGDYQQKPEQKRKGVNGVAWRVRRCGGRAGGARRR